jgi:hypothetical protein
LSAPVTRCHSPTADRKRAALHVCHLQMSAR